MINVIMVTYTIYIIIGALEKEYLYLLENVIKGFEDEILFKLKLSDV